MRKAQQWLQALFKAEGFRGPVLTLLSGTTLATGISYLGEPLLMLIYTLGVSCFLSRVIHQWPSGQALNMHLTTAQSQRLP